jgi:hypothetical protein
LPNLTAKEYLEPMPATIEDHERRIAALEKAQTATGENAIARLEQKVDAILPAVARTVAESEKRVTDVANAAVNRMVDILNERFDEVMEKLDRPKKRKAKK